MAPIIHTDEIGTEVQLSCEEKNPSPACVCTIDGLVDNPVTHYRRLRWIPGNLEAGVPLL